MAAAVNNDMKEEDQNNSNNTLEEKEKPLLEFMEQVHLKYILSLAKQKESLESCMTEHMRMSGIYWAVTSLALMGKTDAMTRDKLLAFIHACYNPKTGGFSGNVGHDTHLLYTCHAILILAVLNALDTVDADTIGSYVASLQNSDGSFKGDKWGEVDTKFTYCALSVANILKQRHKLNIPEASRYITSCRNFDGGFGNLPGCESHGGHIFTAIGSLALLNNLVKDDEASCNLGWWLAERQCDSGGLNGRPEKQADVCYSWWNIASLIMISKDHWINKTKLTEFILKCQDKTDGGISDRPDNVSDIYHTFFGIGGLSLLGYFKTNSAYREIHPVYAIPSDIIQDLGI